MFGKQTLAIRLIRLNYRPVSLTFTFYLKNSKRKLNYFSVKAKMAIWFLRKQNFLLLKCGSVSYLEASIYQGWIWLHIPRPNSCRRQVPHRRRDQQPSVFVLPKDRMQWRIWLEKKKKRVNVEGVHQIMSAMVRSNLFIGALSGPERRQAR